MNVIHKNNNFVKILVAIGILTFIFIVLPSGLIAMFVNSNLTYVLPATFAITLLTLCVILLIRQKRISIYFTAAFIAGLLLLASSVIEFGFSMFTQHTPFHEQIYFSGIMRPNQVSHGLASIGVGFAFVLINFGNVKANKSVERNIQIQNQKLLSIAQFSVGIFFLFSGIYKLINGFQPL